MSTQVDREMFLQTLRASGLLSGKQFRRMLEQLPDRARPHTIARALVQARLLTVFQAEHILRGREKGFFFGPYRILDLIGEGGMGRVYRALHQTMNRTVALKVLAPHLLKTPKARRLFGREVQAAAQLSHPNIVTAYDAGEINGRHFLAMEFVDGPNLEQLVRSQGPLPVGQACEVVRQAAFGLEGASDQGMVHRDVKPANLLLQRGKNDQDYKVKILDFGLARLSESRGEGLGAETIVTPDNTVMGTPDFLSPEQSRSLHNVDIRSDLYSLGCSFYYLLTGRVPFEGGTPLEKLLRQGSEEPTPVEELRPGVVPAVADIVRKLMAKNPDERYQNPQELVEALEPFAESTVLLWQRPGGESEMPTPSPSGGLPSSGESLVGTMPAEISPTPILGHASSFSLIEILRAPSLARRLAWWGLYALAAGSLVLSAYLALNW